MSFHKFIFFFRCRKEICMLSLTVALISFFQCLFTFGESEDHELEIWWLHLPHLLQSNKLKFLCKLYIMLNISASRSRSSLWRWMMNPPRLQIIAWSTMKGSPQTQTVGMSVISQPYLSLMASLNSLLFKLKSMSLLISGRLPEKGYDIVPLTTLFFIFFFY